MKNVRADIKFQNQGVAEALAVVDYTPRLREVAQVGALYDALTETVSTIDRYADSIRAAQAATAMKISRMRVLLTD